MDAFWGQPQPQPQPQPQQQQQQQAEEGNPQDDVVPAVAATTTADGEASTTGGGMGGRLGGGGVLSTPILEPSLSSECRSRRKSQNSPQQQQQQQQQRRKRRRRRRRERSMEQLHNDDEFSATLNGPQNDSNPDLEALLPSPTSSTAAAAAGSPSSAASSSSSMNTFWQNQKLLFPCCCCCCCRLFIMHQKQRWNNFWKSRGVRTCMNWTAQLVLWFTIMALCGAVVWYSNELKENGTDPHLIAWFSAGAFVLLGFPISMWAIIGHLANYNQPHVQVYVVRILFMVPVYSIESWLAMRFHDKAIYIETLRDCYESYVLYSFLQFLIQVLGGEQALVLMLKDKSPTRGIHIGGLQWCVKPWLMGQPIRRSVIHYNNSSSNNKKEYNHHPLASLENSFDDDDCTDTSHSSSQNYKHHSRTQRFSKRVHWTSPFYIKCKFGVLQYVLLKAISAVAVMILELQGLYKEGDFSPKGGYLYVCIVTNVSQCWALYCLVFFYYATKTELAPIRPVGKFLAVKALIFFTWYQSVILSIFEQMDMIPDYTVTVTTVGNGGVAVGGGGNDIIYNSTTYEQQSKEWTHEDVAKGIQDYLICIEMFLAAVFHMFVFSHNEYSPQAVEARSRALQQSPMNIGSGSNNSGYRSNAAANSIWNKHQQKKRMGRSKYAHNAVYAAQVHQQQFRWNRKRNTSDSFENDSVSRSSRSTNVSMNLGMMPHNLEMVTVNNNNNNNDSSETTTVLSSGPTTNWEDPLLQNQEEQQQQLQNDHSMFLSSSFDNTNIADDPLLVDRLQPTLLEPVQDVSNDDEEMDESQRSDIILDYSSDYGEDDDDEEDDDMDKTDRTSNVENKPGFIGALLDSVTDHDLKNSTVGIVMGDYNVERKTLLQHAATSDQYDLFAPNRRPIWRAAVGNNDDNNNSCDAAAVAAEQQPSLPSPPPSR